MAEREGCIDCISKERGSHGQAWRNVHGSYFSDPSTARPYVEAIQRSLRISRPDAVADIGGGDGFVLRQLSSSTELGGARLINVDASQEQLEACHGDLARVCCSALELERSHLIADGTLTVISRSVLHYFGREGQPLFLAKVRSLLRPGEVFVHQPACFATAPIAACMNELYPLMGVDKAYFTPSELEDLHRQAGFEVVSAEWAPPLDLRSEDLAARYRLGRERVDQMVDVMRRYGLDRDGIAEISPGRFRTAFTYRILVLRAR